jgi:hypothetical protein
VGIVAEYADRGAPQTGDITVAVRARHNQVAVHGFTQRILLEELHVGAGERHGYQCRPMLQATTDNDGDAFEIVMVPHAEGGVVACRVQVPAMKVCQLQQHRDSAVCIDEFLESRQESLVVGTAELPAEAKCNDVAFLDR